MRVLTALEAESYGLPWTHPLSMAEFMEHLERALATRDRGDDLLRHDGVTLSRGGPCWPGFLRMHHPYTGPYGDLTNGVTFVSEEKEIAALEFCARRGLRLNFIGAGDRDHDEFLANAEICAHRHPDVRARAWILQHVFFLTEEQARRYGALGFHATTSMSLISVGVKAASASSSKYRATFAPGLCVLRAASIERLTPKMERNSRSMSAGRSSVDWSGQPPGTDSVTMYRIGFAGNAIAISSQGLARQVTRETSTQPLTFEVTLTIGKETQVIMGRAAEIIASVPSVVSAVNAPPVGKAVIHFAEAQAEEGGAALQLSGDAIRSLESPRVREHSEELQPSARRIGSGNKLRDGVQKFPETEGLFEIPNSPHLIHRPCRFKPASDHQDRHFVAAPTEGLNEATPIKHWHLQVENDERRRVNSGQLQRIAPVRSAKHGMPLRP